MENLRHHIENIINNTFKTIDEVYNTNQEGGESEKFELTNSRLIFPKYRNGNTRVSEQELRFLFIEEFNKYCEENELQLFYSIETPTEEKYSFTSNKGESAQFDVVIHDESKKRRCLIEFKNNSTDARKHEKDFKKLSKDGDGKLCYFISIAESSDAGTLGETDGAKEGMIPKFKRFANNDEISFDNITYICHCLNNRGKHPKKGFDTVYAGIVVNNFGWGKKSKLFEK